MSIRALCSDGDNVIENEAGVNEELQAVVESFAEETNRDLSEKPLTAKVLPMKSVGVQGDERSYKHPVVITGQATWNQLNDLSVRITNEVFSVNRVLWLVASRRGVGSPEIDDSAAVRERYMTKDRLDLLRVADDIVMKSIKDNKIFHDIWQFPDVFVPYGNENTNGESIVLRPIQSKEAMTVNFYQMDMPVLTSIKKSLQEIAYVDYVFYDVTNKPPATIEWE